MKTYQTITIVPKNLELNSEQILSENTLKEYLKGIDEDSVVSFENWLAGKSFDKNEIFMWRPAK
jgi:hypothetical protein